MVSMIMTTFNEGFNIGALLEDLLDQTRPPAELVLVDGGSTDNTVAICEAYRARLEACGIALKLRSQPGANIARGRNLAIEIATHGNICVTDAGCRLDPQWCERITKPLLEDRADFVGGFFRPVHHDRFQRILAILTVADTPPRGFMPSSRSIAFKRATWQLAGQYPEWLSWGEDTLFNERCLATGARYVIAADALVFWEVRSTYRAAVKQYYRYAWGDGRRRRLSTSHAINTGTIFGAVVLAATWSPWWLWLFPGYTVFITLRCWRSGPKSDLITAWSIVAGIRVARFVGYVRGLLASLTPSMERS